MLQKSAVRCLAAMASSNELPCSVSPALSFQVQGYPVEASTAECCWIACTRPPVAHNFTTSSPLGKLTPGAYQLSLHRFCCKPQHTVAQNYYTCSASQVVAQQGRARTAKMTLPHYTAETPMFMPVGTQGDHRFVMVTRRPPEKMPARALPVCC